MLESPATFQPRDYQLRAKSAVFRGFKSGKKRLLVVKATGTGKTITSGIIAQEILTDDPRPVLFVAHREELLIQTQEKMQIVMPSAVTGIEQGTLYAPRNASMIIASLPTIARRGTKRLEWLLEQGGPSCIIYDEAHHAASDTALEMMERFGVFDPENPTRLIGLTATPVRLDNKRLIGGKQTDIFQDVAFRYSLVQAIQDGNLVPLRGYAILTETRIDNVETEAGDFKVGQLANTINHPQRNRIAVKHWQDLASDRLTIAFCANVEHAKDAAAEFASVGVPSSYIHGGMSSRERNIAIQRWRVGETRVMTNCMIGTEGFDFPMIGCVLLMRPTKSRALYEQMVGRGTRLADGKDDCLVLDMTDLTSKHDLASLPEITGLPKGINLAGATTTEAAKKLEHLGQQVATLGDVRNMDLGTLCTRAMEVPLYSLSVPDSVRKLTRYRWLQIPGGFAAIWESKGQKLIRAYEQELGWYVEYHAQDGASHPYTYGIFSDLENALRIGDNIIKNSVESDRGRLPLPYQDGGEAITDGQKKLIYALSRNLDIPTPKRNSLTKYEASCLIDQLNIRAILRMAMSKRQKIHPVPPGFMQFK